MPYIDHPLPEVFHVEPIVPLKRKKPPGKPKGAVAKITRDLKEGIIDAAVIVGSDGNGTGGLTGFLVDLAMHHKRAYASLLVKILPLQVSGSGVSGGHIGTVNVVSIPSGTYLSHDEIERLRDGQLPAIEHLPQPIVPEPVPELEPAARLAALEAWLADNLPEDKLKALAGIVGAGEPSNCL